MKFIHVRYEVVELLRSQNGEERHSPNSSQRRTLKNSRRIADGATRKIESSLAQKLEKDRTMGKNGGPLAKKGSSPKSLSPEPKKSIGNQLTVGNAGPSRTGSNAGMDLFVQTKEPKKPTPSTATPSVSMLPTIMTTKPVVGNNGGSFVLTQDRTNPEVFNANPIWNSDKGGSPTEKKPPALEEKKTNQEKKAPSVPAPRDVKPPKKEAPTIEKPKSGEDPKPMKPPTVTAQSSESEKASPSNSETGSIASNDVAPLIPDSAPTTPTRQLSDYFRRASINVPDEPVLVNENYTEDQGLKFVVRGKKKFHPIILSGSQETLSAAIPPELPSDIIS